MQISEEIINRKGARKGADIPHDVLTLLNQGKIESVNLTEWLAVNHLTLLHHVLPSVGLDHHLDGLTSKITQQKAESGMKAIRLIGQLLDEARYRKRMGKNKRKCYMRLLTTYLIAFAVGLLI
ncbi:conserved hypothetical protein [Bacillus altitudinis]|nr:hypothetical protein GA0061086_11172 [Bacillus altitudinis]SPR95272.1 conserved hypothetical protein [Bacillus altitudinis]